MEIIYNINNSKKKFMLDGWQTLENFKNEDRLNTAKHNMKYILNNICNLLNKFPLELLLFNSIFIKYIN